MFVEIQKLPENVEELKALPEAALSRPEHTAALYIAALMRYEEDAQSALDMVNVLRGPAPLSAHDIQFIRDRLAGKAYVVRSYFKGAVPGNDYQPSEPLTVEFQENPYSYDQEGYAKLYLVSGGADSPRPITMRLKPSAGQWFLSEHLCCLADIRTSVSQDPWA